MASAITVDPYWSHNGMSDEKIIASCEFEFYQSYSSGHLVLSQKPGDNTLFNGNFTGLKPGIHALKIHEFGDLSHGCSSVGEVYNPFFAHHGHSNETMKDRMVGDIEQVQARYDKNAEYKNRDGLVDLSGPLSVLGRSMVIYEQEDDHDETEHAPTNDREGRKREGKGATIGCCVIGLVKGEKPKVMY